MLDYTDLPILVLVPYYNLLFKRGNNIVNVIEQFNFLDLMFELRGVRKRREEKLGSTNERLLLAFDKLSNC